MTTGYATRDQASLCDSAAIAVDHARTLGADGATASASAGGGIRITVRDDRAETAVRDAYQRLAVTVLRDGRSGSASTLALDPDSIRRAAQEAFAIAALVQPDPDAGLADPASLACDVPVPEMWAPSGATPDELIERALALETAALGRAARERGVRILESSVTSNDHLWALATSTGFCRSAAASDQAQWISALADTPDGAVRDHAQASDRRIDRLSTPDALADDAIARTVAQRGGRTIATRQAPVIFAARVAPMLVRELVTALSGGPQHRRATVLPDALGKAVTADHLDLTEDPFEPFGMASGAWDPEGVAGARRTVVEAGMCRGYFLGSVSARRLGLRSTGNAGGPWNLTLASRAAHGDAAALRRTMGTGLIVTTLMGGGSDATTGNWTQAVTGFWVEGGEIVHPVTDVTLGGNLKAMWRGIAGVGDDVHRAGPIRTGSILVDTLRIGGTA